jgi:hypothetical protein
MTTTDLKKFPLVFESPFAVFYDVSKVAPRTMLCFWKGFYEVTNEQAMSSVEACLDKVREHKLHYIISDHSELDVLGEEMLEYLDTRWYPQLVKDGLKAEIYIDGESLTTQLSIEFMYENLKNSEQELHTPKVKNIEEALKVAKYFSEKEEERKC